MIPHDVDGQSVPTQDLRLAQIVDEFSRRIADGESIDLTEFIEQHTEYAELLRNLLPAVAALMAAAQPIDPVEDDPAGPHLLHNSMLGDFLLKREIGRGGMGVVFEADQLSMGRKVALKVLPYAAIVNEKSIKRFHNEVRAAASLDHAHIVSVYAVGEERGVHYYAMQLIRGQSLASVIAQFRSDATPHVALSDKFPPPSLLSVSGESAPQPTTTTSRHDPQPSSTALAQQDTRDEMRESTIPVPQQTDFYRKVACLAIDVAEALQHAHEHGIVHRDIKPANLLLDLRGKVWVTDFGLAQTAASGAITRTGDVIGTLRYMPPEQALAKQVPVDPRADVYSLGATLYELLTFEPPFDGHDREELLRKIAFEEPARPRKIRRSIPLDLQTIVLKAIEKTPADRYATAQALETKLRGVRPSFSFPRRRESPPGVQSSPNHLPISIAF